MRNYRIAQLAPRWHRGAGFRFAPNGRGLSARSLPSRDREQDRLSKIVSWWSHQGMHSTYEDLLRSVGGRSLGDHRQSIRLPVQ